MTKRSDARRLMHPRMSGQVYQCRNCGHPVPETYCGQCGAKKYEGRLTLALIATASAGTASQFIRRFFRTLAGIYRDPATTVGDYLDGRQARYQGPIPFFLIGYAWLSLAAYVFDGQRVAAGSFHGINQWWVLAGALGPVVIAYALVTRTVLTFFETFISFVYLIGAALFALPLFMLLQYVFPAAVSVVPEYYRYLIVDIPYQVITSAIALRYVLTRRLSVSRYTLALLLSALYMFAFRYIVVMLGHA